MKQELGISFKDFLTRLRISQAAYGRSGIVD